MPALSPRPARGLRVSRLPLLLAYLLVLLGTPYGEAGFLWMHLAGAHSGPAEPAAKLGHATGLRLGDAVFASPPGHEPATLAAHEHAGARARTHEHSVAHGRTAAPKHDDAASHAAAHADAVEHEHQEAHEHQHADAPEHHERIASAAGEPVGRSVAPDQPHEHGGRVHTHRQHPVPDAELLTDTLSRFYLAPRAATAPSPGAEPRHARQVRRVPHQAAARIDTPPPRLPG